MSGLVLSTLIRCYESCNCGIMAQTPQDNLSTRLHISRHAQNL
jgi:hypothetical protein